jgi:alpha-beta hydrolase superfamily lysophospholipase
MMLAMLALLLAGLTVYGGALAWLWFSQEKLLFAPQVLPPDQVLAQAPDIHEVSIDVPGARLSALHLRLPDPKGVVFFLHGNGGSLASWFVNPEYYRRMNFDLFMIDYRGFGKSTGEIQSEEQMRADVRAAWASIAGRYAQRKVVVYGRSLGSGLAAGLAAELSATRPPDLTVLVSPYRSLCSFWRLALALPRLRRYLGVGARLGRCLPRDYLGVGARRGRRCPVVAHSDAVGR